MREQVGGAPWDYRQGDPAVGKSVNASPHGPITADGKNQPVTRPRDEPREMPLQLRACFAGLCPHELGLPTLRSGDLPAPVLERVDAADPYRVDHEGDLFREDGEPYPCQPAPSEAD
jgi:hypothetical protein